MTSYLDPLLGRTCTRLTFDAYAPPLVLWFLYEGPTARIEISGAFRLSSEASTDRFDPTLGPPGLGSVLALIGRTVTQAQERDDGSLQLEFTGGLVGEDVAPDDFEAWWFDIADEDGDITATE